VRFGNSLPATGRSSPGTPLEPSAAKGVAGRLLTNILNEGKARSYQRVSLETGSMAAFAPARAPYARFGFKTCAPSIAKIRTASA
jgi:hypothetical protein